MAYTTVVTITHDTPVSRLGAIAGSAHRGREAIQAVADLLLRLASGNDRGSVEIQAGGTAQVRATGTINLGAISGAVGATIDGTAVTVATTGGVAGTIPLLIAAINANATVNKKVYAEAASATQVRVTSLVPGVVGNKLTLALSGTGVTVSGATLTGGAGADVAPVIHSRS